MFLTVVHGQVGEQDSGTRLIHIDTNLDLSDTRYSFWLVGAALTPLHGPCEYGYGLGEFGELK